MRCSKERALYAAAHPAGDFEIVEGAIGPDAAARSAVDKTELHQVRLIDLFDGVGLFIDGSGDGVDAYWSAAVFFEQRKHDFLVDFIQAEAVYFQQVERESGDGQIDVAGGANLRVIVHAAKQTVGDARRASAAAGYFLGAIAVHSDSQ